MVGIIILRRLLSSPVGDATLCSGGCGLWLPPSDVGGVVAMGVVILLILIGVFGRTFMFSNSSGGDDGD
jgi:hypothetical protein